MHWLLLLALLSSSTRLEGGGSTSSLNRLAENSLRQQLGSVRSVSVRVDPGDQTKGDFDSFDVSLDGFSADRLMSMANRADQTASRSRSRSRRQGDEVYGPADTSDEFPGEEERYDSDSSGDWQPRRNSLNAGQVGDLLGGILGGTFGQKSSMGRIGRIRFRATNFTFQGTRYNALSADMGEVRFDWGKALRGDFDVQSIAPGTLALSLRGDQAARLLAPRLPSLRDVRVRFSGGRALIGAKSVAYGLNVPFEVGARLSVQQNRVMANDFSASVARLRLPSFVLDELTRGLNPLYDFDPQRRWPLAINLSTAQATNDMLAMRGGIQWLGFGSSARRREERDSSSERDNRNRRERFPDDDYDYDYRDNDRNRESRDRIPQDILGGIFGR